MQLPLDDGRNVWTCLKRYVVVHGVEVTGVDIRGFPRVVSLNEMDPNSIVEKPRCTSIAIRISDFFAHSDINACDVPGAGEVERGRAVDEDEAEGLDVEPDGGVDGLAEAGDVVERHQRHVLVQLLGHRRADEAVHAPALLLPHVRRRALALFSPFRLASLILACAPATAT